MNIFAGLWSKVAAFFAVLSAVFYFFIKYQRGEIKELEHENKVIKKNSEIQSENDEFKATVISAEQDEILKAISNEKNKSTLDRLNNF